MLHNISVLLTLFLCVVFFPQAASAQHEDGVRALDKLSELKVYFDVKADSAAKLEKRLIWINDSYDQARQQGLKATFIIGIRSQASFFVTKGDEYIDEEEAPTKKRIEKQLQDLVKRGVYIEQCGLSAELFDIDPQDFLPELTVVKNSYISIGGYQNKGYAYVPM